MSQQSNNDPEVDKYNPYNDQNKLSSNLDDRESASNLDSKNQPDDPFQRANQIKNSEEEGSSGWTYNKSKNSSRNNQSWSARVKGLRKKKGPAALLGALLIGGAGLSFLGPLSAPFALISILSDDLNDQLASLEIRKNHIFRNKIQASRAAADVISGCRTISIKCKFKTLSPREVERLKRAGIEVEGRDGVAGRRLIPSEFKFQGQTFTPEAWRSHLEANPVARNAQLRSSNMKFIGYSDRSFTGRVLARWGMSKKQPALTGNRTDRINQLLTAAGTDSLDNVRFIPVVDDEGNPAQQLTDADGNPVLDRNGNPRIYTDAAADRIQNDIQKVRTAPKSLTPKTKIALGALSVIGYADLACTAKNMIGTAAQAAAIANRAAMAKHYWSFASRVHQTQAGDTDDPMDLTALGDYLTQTDTRRQIIDLSGTAKGLESTGTAGEVEPALMDNPDFGKSGMDSGLLSMSINGGVAPRTLSSTMFTLGGGVGAFFGIIGTVAAAADKVAGCGFVQNPIVRGVGIAATIALVVVTGGGFSAAQVAQVGGMIVGMIILSMVLENLLSGNPLEVLADGDEKVGRVDSLWTGAAATEEAAAQARGLMPASAEEIVAYQSVRSEIANTYLAAEREEAGHFDVKNPYSTVSLINTNIRKNIGYNISAASLLAQLPTFVGSALFQSTGAQPIDTARFKQCDDEDLRSIGIDADVQCNVRYTMPKEDLELNVNHVAEWMEMYGCPETNGCVALNSETGLPDGYIPPDAAQQQSALMGLVRGATVGQFFSEKNLPNDYAKFLEYCAYRSQPYGRSYAEPLWGEAEEEWRTGENCRKKGAPWSYYRIYTLDKTVEEALSEETYNTAGTRSGASPIMVTGSDQELAQMILDNDNIDIVDRYRYQFTNYANGNSSCYLDSDLLKLIAGLGQVHKFQIYSVNRSCTGSTAGSGVTSHHWQGIAVDISIVDGVRSTGTKPTDIALIRSASTMLPNKGLIVGQRYCRNRDGVRLDIPPGARVREIEDPICNHIHLAVED